MARYHKGSYSFKAAEAQEHNRLQRLLPQGTHSMGEEDFCSIGYHI